MAHEGTAYEEWGFSGSVQYRPGKDGRGLSMNLGSACGATDSGVQSRWTARDAIGLARASATNASQRFQAELGDGFPVRRRTDARWIPFVRAESTDGGAQSLRLGVTFTSGSYVEMGLEFGRRENARALPKHAFGLNGTIRW